MNIKILSFKDWKNRSKVFEKENMLTEVSAVISNADITAEELKKAITVVNGLVKRGFTKNEAIGLAGNMSVESRFDVNASDGSAIGLCQWDGVRKKAILAYAKAKNKEHTDFSLQLDFIRHEMKDYYLQYVKGVPKELVYVNTGTVAAPKYVKTRKDITSQQAVSRDFEVSTGVGKTIASLTKELCDRVFRPFKAFSHIEKRMANAIKIGNAVS